jgi:arsenite oxidase small subunit
MPRLSRRHFLKLTGSGAAVGTLSLSPLSHAQQSPQVTPGSTTLPYPRDVVAKLGDLTVNEPLYFTYPYDRSPCVVIRKEREVKGGVGPQKDVVAYSTQCTHMGCPVNYDKQAGAFKCPCHYSIFDPDNAGQMVIGQATEKRQGAFPAIALEWVTRDCPAAEGHLSFLDQQRPYQPDLAVRLSRPALGLPQGPLSHGPDRDQPPGCRGLSPNVS